MEEGAKEGEEDGDEDEEEEEEEEEKEEEKEQEEKEEELEDPTVAVPECMVCRGACRCLAAPASSDDEDGIENVTAENRTRRAFRDAAVRAPSHAVAGPAASAGHALDDTAIKDRVRQLLRSRDRKAPQRSKGQRERNKKECRGW